MQDKYKKTMSKRQKSWNKIILNSVTARPIAFNGALASVASSAAAGLLMSQLLYWWGKGSDKEWIYKTIEEIKEETCLTRSEQDTAIKKWIKLGILKKQLRGVPPKRHFQIDTDKLIHLLKVENQIVENGKSNCESEPHITERTTESTKQRFRINNTGERRKTKSEFVSVGKILKKKVPGKRDL